MITAEKLAANRRNAQRSTGPRTPEGKARSRANAVKHGLACSTVIPGDDEALYAQRIDDWVAEFEPQGPVEEMLVRTAVVATVKLERCTQAEFAQAARSRRETIATWDHEQAARLSQILLTFETDPATTVTRLEEFCAGCDWLMGQWIGLLQATSACDSWTDVQIGHAQRLLGLLPEGSQSGDSHADEARACLLSRDRASLIESELDRLLALRDELWEHQDGPALAEAINLAALDTSPAGALRHRYQLAAFQQFFRSLTRLERNRGASPPSTSTLGPLGRFQASRARRQAAKPAAAPTSEPPLAPAPNEPSASQTETSPPPAPARVPQPAPGAPNEPMPRPVPQPGPSVLRSVPAQFLNQDALSGAAGAFSP